jgi:hypothetical protein
MTKPKPKSRAGRPRSPSYIKRLERSKRRDKIAAKAAELGKTVDELKEHVTTRAAEGRTIREVYQAELDSGLSVVQVATKYGVSRQAVHGATVGHAKRIELQRELDRKRYTPSVRNPYRCSVCGEQGHSAARHRDEVLS